MFKFRVFDESWKCVVAPLAENFFGTCDNTTRTITLNSLYTHTIAIMRKTFLHEFYHAQMGFFNFEPESTSEEQLCDWFANIILTSDIPALLKQVDREITRHNTAKKGS